MNEIVKQAIVVTNDDDVDESQAIERVAFFNEDGTSNKFFSGAMIMPIVCDSADDETDKTIDNEEPVDNSLVMIKFTYGNEAENADIRFEGGLGNAFRLRNFVPANLVDPPENETVIIGTGAACLFFLANGNLWRIPVYYLNSIPEWVPAVGGSS